MYQVIWDSTMGHYKVTELSKYVYYYFNIHVSIKYFTCKCTCRIIIIYNNYYLYPVIILLLSVCYIIIKYFNIIYM